MDLGTRAMEMVWVGALAAPPLTVIAAGACLLGRCRPATRHALWAAALVSFIMPAVAGIVWRADWFQTSRLAPAGTGPIAERATAKALDAAAEAERHEGKVRRESAAPAVPERDMVTPDLAIVVDRGAAPREEWARPEEVMGVVLPAVTFDEVGHRTGPSVDTEGLQGVWACSVPDPAAESPSACDDTRAGDNACERGSGSDVGASDVAPRDGSVAAGERGETAQTGAESGSNLARDDQAASSEPADAAEGSSGSVVARSVEPALTPPAGDDGAAKSAGRADGRVGSAPASGPTVWGEWVTHMLVVRDAIASMPAIPPVAWGIGAGLLVLVMGLRSWSLYRVVRSGRAASDDVASMVREAAREIGLGRPPLTMMVRDRVSPMIWCGARPRLVLPQELWEDLDEASRRAVIVHELAHLKRRDHWLCWIEAVVRVMYWWHPVAWWVCRRVREEADASCDVWVTSLMPKCRRAYAEALIATKSYLNLPGRRAPVGLGVMSNRTKRLARRLTMVMTQKSRPRASVVGSFLAIGVIAAGMFVMPGLACPPDEQAKAKAPKATTTSRIVTLAGQDKAKVEAECEASCAAACDAAKAAEDGVPAVTFFGEAPALEAMFGRGENDDEGLRRLEERLRRLEEQLRRLESQQRGSGVGGMSTMQAPGMGGGIGPGAPRRPGAARVAPEAVVIERRAVEDAVRRAQDEYRASVNRGDVARALEGMKAYSTTMPADAARQAELAAKELHEAMIAHGQGGLGLTQPGPLVINTEGQTHTEEYRLPEGKLKAMIALMERDDVPVFIERHPDRIVVHGTDSQHRVFRAFVQLINPEQGTAGDMRPRTATGTPAPRASNRVPEAKARAEEIRRQQREMERRVKEVEKKADKTRSKADKLRSQAESADERSETMREQAEEEQGEVRKQNLLSQAEDFASQARSLESQAEAAERDADVLEAEAQRLEQAAEDLEAALESAESALEELDGVEIGAATVDALAPSVPMTPRPPVGAPSAGPAPTSPVPPTPPSAPFAPAAGSPVGAPSAPTPPPAAPAPAER
ncbi:MAG: M56 family metallopeptidase [Phycisphaerales bacterium]